MRYALIGCGRVAPNHIVAAKASGLEIVGLCDLDPEKAVQFRKDMELSETIPVYADAEAMMKEQKPELVAIASSSGDHAHLALSAIRLGIHVIVEKPIALSLSDADEMIREAKAHGVKLCVSHQNRFNPTIQSIHEAVSQGRLGKILHGAADIRWYRGEDYYSQAAWRGTWKEDGGALMNQCIHDIDLLIWMLGGEPKTVFGFTTNQIHPYIEAEDLGMALVKFSNGSYGLIEGTTNVYPKNLEETLYIFGQNGTVKAGGTSDNIIEASLALLSMLVMSGYESEFNFCLDGAWIMQQVSDEQTLIQLQDMLGGISPYKDSEREPDHEINLKGKAMMCLTSCTADTSGKFAALCESLNGSVIVARDSGLTAVRPDMWMVSKEFEFTKLS